MRVLAAHILEHALRRVALAVVLRRTIALHDGLGRQGEDLALLGMHHHRAQHLVVIRDVTVLVVLLAAVLAMHARRGEIPRPVDREQVVPVQPGEPLQTLAALQRREYPFERHAQLPRVHLVEPLAQRRVARRALNPVQSLQIRPHHLVGACIAVELKQRRILQPEHRKPRHQTIAQAEPARGHRVLELVEGLAHPAQQPRCAQCLPQPPLGHVDSPIAGEIMAIMLNSRSNVYENIFSSASQPPDSSTLLQPAGIAGGDSPARPGAGSGACGDPVSPGIPSAPAREKTGRHRSPDDVPSCGCRPRMRRWRSRRHRARIRARRARSSLPAWRARRPG